MLILRVTLTYTLMLTLTDTDDTFTLILTHTDTNTIWNSCQPVLTHSKQCWHSFTLTVTLTCIPILTLTLRLNHVDTQTDTTHTKTCMCTNSNCDPYSDTCIHTDTINHTAPRRESSGNTQDELPGRALEKLEKNICGSFLGKYP